MRFCVSETFGGGGGNEKIVHSKPMKFNMEKMKDKLPEILI